MHGPTSGEDLSASWSNKHSWFETHGRYRSAEWIVDCYRMRVDDDAVHGSNFHGLNEINMSESSGISLDSRTMAFIHVKDFLKFFKLGVRNDVIPPSKFNFALCLGFFAPNLLMYPFEKHDAKVKWGGENALSMRPSLRRTAEIIYGLSCMYTYDDVDAQQRGEQAQEEVAEMINQGLDKTDIAIWETSLFNHVGGKQLWINLFQSLIEFYAAHE